jgi:hypothetical protein
MDTSEAKEKRKKDDKKERARETETALLAPGWAGVSAGRMCLKRPLFI